MRIRTVLSSAKQAVSVLFYLALESDCLGKALNVREQLVGLISSLSLRNSLSLSLYLCSTRTAWALDMKNLRHPPLLEGECWHCTGVGKKERQIEQERKQLPT